MNIRQQFIMELSIHEDNEISSLRKTNKILKYFFILLSVLAIVPIVLTIVYAHKKSQTQEEIANKQQTLSDLQHQLEEQNYIYQFGDMNISQFVISLDKETSSRPIKIIELQQNTLQVFEGNVIPGVETLMLDNNPLKVFSNNYFPDLKNFSIMTGSLNEFCNNYLPNVKEMTINSRIGKFNKNTLNVRSMHLDTQQFIENNIYNLNKLDIRLSDNLNITSNYLPSLQFLEMHQTQNLTEKCNYNIRNNTFGKLLTFNVSLKTPIHSLSIQFNNFPALKNITINESTAASEISHNQFPSLQNINIDILDRKLDVFPLNIINNSMPMITNFTANNYSQIQILSSNYMPSIKYLDLSSTFLSTVNNNTFQSLQYANFSYCYLSLFNIVAPRLKILDLSGNGGMSQNGVIDCPQLQTLIIERGSMINLQFTSPNLKILRLSFGKFVYIRIQNSSNIIQAHLDYNHLKAFAEPWMGLRFLDLTSNKIQTFNVGIYPEIQVLKLDYNNISKISIMKAQKLKLLSLDSNILEYFNGFVYSSLPLLQTLSAENNSMTEIQIVAPKLIDLNLASNFLKQINLQGCPSLTSVNIQQNQIAEIKGLKGYLFKSFRASGNPIKVFSHNQFKISAADGIGGIPLFQLEEFEGNHITTFSTSNPLPLTMSSANLSIFKNNTLTFGVIHFPKYIKNLTEILKNDFTVKNGNITINCPNLQLFQGNTAYFCNHINIDTTNLKNFSSNTFINVSTLSIVNSKLSVFQKNSVKGIKNIYFDNNLLTNNIVDELIDMRLGDVKIISLVNNLITDKVDAERKLKQAYPNVVLLI